MEPVIGVRAKREKIGLFADSWETGTAEDLDGNHVVEAAEIELGALAEAREVRDDENFLVFVLANIGENLAVAGIEEFQGAASKRFELFALGDDALHPPEQGVRIVL